MRILWLSLTGSQLSCLIYSLLLDSLCNVYIFNWKISKLPVVVVGGGGRKRWGGGIPTDFPTIPTDKSWFPAAKKAFLRTRHFFLLLILLLSTCCELGQDPEGRTLQLKGQRVVFRESTPRNRFRRVVPKARQDGQLPMPTNMSFYYSHVVTFNKEIFCLSF